MNKKISKNNLNKLICIFVIIFNLLPIFSYTYAVPANSADNTTSTAENSPTSADTAQNNLTLYSKADILMDMNTGNILYEKNSLRKNYIQLAQQN